MIPFFQILVERRAMRFGARLFSISHSRVEIDLIVNCLFDEKGGCEIKQAAPSITQSYSEETLPTSGIDSDQSELVLPLSSS
jgi:hypothetical protein